MFGCEVVDFSRHLPGEVARIDHQHLAPSYFGLVFIEEPQFARHRPRVEEAGSDRHHRIHVVGLNQLSGPLPLGRQRTKPEKT